MWLQKVPDTVGVTVWRLGCSPQLWAESRLWGRELERARLWVRAPGKWPSIRAELPSQGGNWRAPQQTRPGCTGYPWEEGEKFQTVRQAVLRVARRTWFTKVYSQSQVRLLQPHGLQLARLLCPWDFPGRILEWVGISFSRGSSQPRGGTHVPCIRRRFLH